jgi:hypothetical protein
MPKGGPREGAGRPRGSRGKRTRDSIAKAEALAPTPLEVLLESMHAARAEGERAEAVEYASIAAPYVHPKVTPSPASAPVYDEPDYSVLSDAELEQMENCFRRRLSNHPPAKRRLRNLA